jgi:hypothetical protein
LATAGLPPTGSGSSAGGDSSGIFIFMIGVLMFCVAAGAALRRRPRTRS